MIKIKLRFFFGQCDFKDDMQCHIISYSNDTYFRNILDKRMHCRFIFSKLQLIFFQRTPLKLSWKCSHNEYSHKKKVKYYKISKMSNFQIYLFISFPYIQINLKSGSSNLTHSMLRFPKKNQTRKVSHICEMCCP